MSPGNWLSVAGALLAIAALVTSQRTVARMPATATRGRLTRACGWIAWAGAFLAAAGVVIT